MNADATTEKKTLGQLIDKWINDGTCAMHTQSMIRERNQLLEANRILTEACLSAVAALTQPIQTSGRQERHTCDVLRYDASLAVKTLKTAIESVKGQA